MTEKTAKSMELFTIEYSIYRKEKGGKKSKGKLTKREPEKRMQQTVMACDEDEAAQVFWKGRRKKGLKIETEIDTISIR